MGYQLILRKNTGQDVSELFARGVCLDFDGRSFEVGAGLGLADGYALEFVEDGRQVSVHNKGALPVTLGDGVAVAPGESAVIRHGATVAAGETEIHLYQLRPRPRPSRIAGAVGVVSIVGVLVALFLEIGAIVGLPSFLIRSDAVRTQVEVQELTDRVDELRKRLNSRELASAVEKDSLSSAYLSSLQGEMEHRVAYLRRYADSLTHEERRQQLDNLDRLEKILDKFSESSAVTPPLPEVQIDDPVRQLIENE